MGSLRGESYTPHQPRVSPRLWYSSSSVYSSSPGRLNGVEKLFRMNSTCGMLPALNCHICFLAAASVLHPAGLFANSANALCLIVSGGCILMSCHSRVCWTLCECRHAEPRCPTLACQTCYANRCTHMPAHSVASCVWPGASMISCPRPAANF